MAEPISSPPTTSSSSKNGLISDFQSWFRSGGGELDARLDIRIDDDRGVHIQAISGIPFNHPGDSSSNISEGPTTSANRASTKSKDLVVCPEKLMITEPRARGFIRDAQSGRSSTNDSPSSGTGGSSTDASGEDLQAQTSLSERQWIASYMVIHLIADDEDDRHLVPQPLELPHLPYTRLLPSAILTPLFYTQAERGLLRGTNVDPSIDRRRADWEEEYQGAKNEVCRGRLEGLKKGFSWQRYLLASTYITSRAFPSSLLRSSHIATIPADTTAATPDSYPIMIPGIDLLNHRRTEPVTWTPYRSEATSPVHVGFGVRRSIEAGEELFNNYGPKGNEELLLAYGFVIPSNPSSSCSVKLGFKGQLPEDARMGLEAKGLKVDETFQVRANEPIPERLIRVVRVCVGGQGEDEPLTDLEEALKGIEGEDEDVERRTMVEMDAMDVLERLFEAKLQGASEVVERIREEKGSDGIREKVWKDCFEYAQGQRDILQAKFNEISTRMEEWQSRLEEIGFGPGDDDEGEAD